MGAVSKHQGSGQDAYAVGPARKYPQLFNKLDILLANEAIYIDTSPAGKRLFSPDDIVIGDHVQILAHSSGAVYHAIRLDRIAPSATVELRGPGEPEISDPLLSILSVNADTSLVDDMTGFKDADGDPVTRDTFFTHSNPGCELYVAGQWSGINIVASAAQLLESPQSGGTACAIPGHLKCPQLRLSIRLAGERGRILSHWKQPPWILKS